MIGAGITGIGTGISSPIRTGIRAGSRAGISSPIRTGISTGIGSPIGTGISGPVSTGRRVPVVGRAGRAASAAGVGRTPRPTATAPRHRRRGARWQRALLVGLSTLALSIAAYGLSPYLALWRLEQALARGDSAALGGLVDLAAVRAELRRRLDKTQPTLIGDLSAPFIEWLARVIRTPEGRTLDPAVSLDWLHGLLAPAPGWTATGFRRPTLFCTQATRPDQPPVTLCLRPALTGWRVVAAWY